MDGKDVEEDAFVPFVLVIVVVCLKLGGNLRGVLGFFDLFFLFFKDLLDKQANGRNEPPIFYVQ